MSYVNPVIHTSPAWSSLDPRPHTSAGANPRASRVVGDPLLSALSGALGGAAAGVAALATADAVSTYLGRGVELFVLAGSGDKTLGITLAAVTGAMLGGLLGCLSRRTRRLSARLLFFTILIPALCVFTHAFLLQRFTPEVASLPLTPFLVASVVYALGMTIARPIVRRGRLVRGSLPADDPPLY